MTLAVGQILRPGDFTVTGGSASIVGASNQLGDDTDATYVDLFSSNNPIWGFFGRFDKVQANVTDHADPAYPYSPPLVVDLWVRATGHRVDASGSLTDVLCVATVDLPTLTGDIALNMTIPADGAVHEVATDISPYYSSWGHTIDDVVADLQSGTTTVSLSTAIFGGGVPTDQSSRVFEWAIRIWYDIPETTAKPKLRVHPRDDLNRVYPTPRSVQGSNRVAGGTYR